MKLNKQMRESAVELTLNLPRVVVNGKKVAHILINGVNIYELGNKWHREVKDTACHNADDKYIGDEDYWAVRWATPDDPTCKNCLTQLRGLSE